MLNDCGFFFVYVYTLYVSSIFFFLIIERFIYRKPKRTQTLDRWWIIIRMFSFRSIMERRFARVTACLYPSSFLFFFNMRHLCFPTRHTRCAHDESYLSTISICTWSESDIMQSNALYYCDNVLRRTTNRFSQTIQRRSNISGAIKSQCCVSHNMAGIFSILIMIERI